MRGEREDERVMKRYRERTRDGAERERVVREDGDQAQRQGEEALGGSPRG